MSDFVSMNTLKSTAESVEVFDNGVDVQETWLHSWFYNKNMPCWPGELNPALSLDARDTLRVTEFSKKYMNQKDHATST